MDKVGPRTDVPNECPRRTNTILPEWRNWRCWKPYTAWRETEMECSKLYSPVQWKHRKLLPHERFEQRPGRVNLSEMMISFLWSTIAPPLSSLFWIYGRQILCLSDNTLEHCRSLKPLMLQHISSAGLLFAVRFQESAIIISRCGYGMKCNIYQGQFINQACLQRQRCGERTMA